MFSIQYIWAFIFIIFISLELTSLKALAFFATAPDFILILTVFAGLNHGLVYGAGLGFAGGLAREIFSRSLLGPGTFSLTFIGFLAGVFGRRLFYQNIFIQVIIVFIATLLKMALTNWLLIFIHHSPYLGHIISQAFYNALLTPPLFFLLSLIFRDKQ